MELDLSNARTRLCKEYKSITGLKIEPEWSIWFELYREYFCDKLNSLGFTNEDDFVKLLEVMGQHENVGSFLYDEDEQEAELAAFGLILFDRILRAEAANVNHAKVFAMHQELMECARMVNKDWYDEGIKIDRKALLSAVGSIGGKAKNKKHEALRNWVKERMGNRPKTMNEAEKLFKELPPHLVDVSERPARFIYDVLREKKKPE